MLGEYAAAVGMEGIGMDTAADPAHARRTVPETIALQGNLDPMALLAGGDALRVEAGSILAALRGRPFVFNLGHGIVAETPPEHVAALTELVRAG